MAWIYFVKGLAYTVSAGEDDAYELATKIENTDEFKALDEYAKEMDCCLRTAVDCEDRNEVSVIAGIELWPERHIYKGRTVVADKELDESIVEYFDQKLYELLVEKLALKADVAHGVVLHQFD